MKFIKKHITALVVILVCLILVTLAAIAVYRMFYPSNDKSVCGYRGNGPEVNSEIVTLIKENKMVNNVSYQHGLCETTIKFYIDVNSDVKIDKAKGIANIIVENLSLDAIEFYDVTVYLTQKNGEMKEYPAIGQKSKSSKEFNWVINKEVSDSEE